MGGVFDEPDEADGGDSGERSQRPMETDPSKYYETGRLAMGIGADGLPVVLGGAPRLPEAGWSYDNLICAKGPDRPACKHYARYLSPAAGVARGFDEMRQMRRFCKELATASELFEITENVYGCDLRSPPDPRSLRVLDDFEERQRDITNEVNETGGELDF